MKTETKERIERHFSPFLIEKLSLCKVVFNNIKRRKNGLDSFSPSQHDRILVLGNGPSLSDSIEKYGEQIKQYELMCVNQFVETPIYETLKPKYYVLADPDYWKDENLRNDPYVARFMESIKKKTTWNIVLFISEAARHSQLVMELSAMGNVIIVFYSNVGVSMECVENRKYFALLKKDYVAPPAQTVLNTCLALAIYYGFKEVFLFGADTSWHEQYRIDPKSNDLYIEDQHFYGTELILAKKYSDNESNIAKEFFSVANVLSLYQLIKEYAQKNGVKIYNASEYSWIDVFERKKLDA